MKHLQTEEQLEEALSAPHPIVIDFWGPTCGPCHAMAPVYDALDELYKDEPVDFYKVNTQEAPVLARTFNVRSIPTFIFLLEGEVIDHNIGGCDPQRLKKKVDRILSKYRGEGFLTRLFGGGKKVPS